MSPIGLRPGLLAILVALLGVIAAGCIEREVVAPTEVEVTPGEVPAEIEGAGWGSLPVAYCTVPDEAGFIPHDRFVALVQDAFAEWGAEVTHEGDCEALETRNGRNEIGWGEAPGGAEGVHRAGFTEQLFRPCPGGCPSGAQSEIVEADIVIAQSPPEDFRTEECLFTALLHEAGHFLGVPHLEPPAVMAPVSRDCPASLTDADREAYAALYGAEEESG